MSRIAVPLAAALLAAVVAAGVVAGPAPSDPPAVGSKVALTALPAPAGTRATVVVFTSTECPMARKYVPRLTALARQYQPKGVAVIAVNSNANEDPAAMAEQARLLGDGLAVVRDEDASAADRLGATMTPEAVLLDAAGVIRYRGRIDDSTDPEAVKSRDLADALDAVLAGREVVRKQTVVVGCVIRRPAQDIAAPAGAPTYTGQVAAILHDSCISCHRPGEVAPFSLEGYEQARAWAQAIKQVTGAGRMPPWKPVEGHGHFQDSRRMAEADVRTLSAWADAGAPQGDPAGMPRLTPHPDPQGWRLGTPDLVVRSPEPYELAAEGKDVYRCFVIPTDFDEDRFVRAVEYRPDNRAVVHHMIAYLDTSGTADRLDAAEPGPGYTTSGGGPGFTPAGMLGGWAPGNQARFLPDGVAYRLPKGARIVLEVHYHKSGRPEKDRSQVGIHLAKEPVRQQMHFLPLVNFWFRLQPGNADQEVTAEMVAPTDLTLHAITPHMHLLGRQMTVTATLPDGQVLPLIKIDDWDFNYQDTYWYQEPMRLPRGTKLSLSARYDNSTGNPRNPSNPPKVVTWGEETTDEMCIAFFSVTRDAEDLTRGAAGGDAHIVPQGVVSNLLRSHPALAPVRALLEAVERRGER